jgi:uncharacterized membrane protein YqhA
MLDLNFLSNFLFENSNHLFEFSRNNCIAICGFLVPANMIATVQTMIFVGLRSPLVSNLDSGAVRSQISIMPIIMMSIVYAIAMILHVFTWFLAGVVMAPTFILLSLGIVCLSINIWAIAAPMNMSKYLRQIWDFGICYYKLITLRSAPNSSLAGK